MSLLLFFGGIAVSSSSKDPVRRGAFYPTQDELRELLGKRREEDERQRDLQEAIDRSIEAAWDAIFATPLPVEAEPEAKPPPEEIQAPIPIIGRELSRRAMRLLTRAPKPKEESQEDREYRAFAFELNSANPDLDEYVSYIETAIQKLMNEKLSDSEIEGQLARLDETVRAFAESKEYRRIKRYLDS